MGTLQPQVRAQVLQTLCAFRLVLCWVREVLSSVAGATFDSVAVMEARRTHTPHPHCLQASTRDGSCLPLWWGRWCSLRAFS